MTNSPCRALLAFILLCIPTAAFAQDASTCCADLEERIAELKRPPRGMHNATSS